MYFPYYGKKAHVSTPPRVSSEPPGRVLLTDAHLPPNAEQLPAAPGGREAAAGKGGLQQGAAGGVPGRGLGLAQQR